MTAGHRLRGPVAGDVQSLVDYLTGVLIGAFDRIVDVEWHHDGKRYLPTFTATDRETGAAVVVHIDEALDR